MTPRMTTREPFAVLGVVGRIERGSESPEVFGRIWKRFESRRQEIESVATQKAYFGVSCPTKNEAVTEYLAGMMVAAGTAAAEGLEERTVSGGQYAVFECAVEAIGATYRDVFGAWLPSAAVQFDSGREPFEQYPAEGTPELLVRLHIPVVSKGQGGE
jgi:predicted transcriptional regulator YdeE